MIKFKSISNYPGKTESLIFDAEKNCLRKTNLVQHQLRFLSSDLASFWNLVSNGDLNGESGKSVCPCQDEVSNFLSPSRLGAGHEDGHGKEKAINEQEVYSTGSI